MPRPSLVTCFTFLDQRFSKSFEVHFSESLSADVVSALKLWIVLVILIGCGCCFVPNYLYVSLTVVAVSIALVVFLYTMGDSKQLHWEKFAIVYLCILILMAPCTDQINMTTQWIVLGEASDLPTTSAVAALRTVLFFGGSFVIPVRSHLAVNLLAVAVASILYWKYLLGFARGPSGPSIGIEEADVTAFACMLVAIVGGWKREQFLRGRFLDEEQNKVRDRDRHLMEMQSLQASALAFEDAAMLLCDIVLQVDKELNIVDPPESFITIFEQRATRRPLLELLVPADREQVKDLVHSLTALGIRRPSCAVVTLQKPSGATLCCDAVMFATSQHHCVLGFHFKKERADKASSVARARPLGGSRQGASEHSGLSVSGLSAGSVLTYTISSNGPSTNRVLSEMASTITASSHARRPAEADGLSNASPSTAGGSPRQAHSMIAAMVQAEAQANAARPEARLRKVRQVATQEQEVQTQWQQPQMVNKATNTKQEGRPPMMPGTPTGLAPPQQRVLRIKNTQNSDQNSDAASEFSNSYAFDSRSSVSSVSKASSASDMDMEDNEAAGQCAAVLMAIEMCRSTRRACCQFHASAAVVAKLSKKMRAASCDIRWKPNSEWQCPSCFCMLAVEPDTCFVCGLPNPALES